MDDIDLLDVRETCRLIGGSKPIHRGTLYKGIADGRFPPPVKIGPGASRWLRGEIVAAVVRLINKRPAA
jgi:predicted DNA-binding transcriptional regulator AlpA